jgi:hypothetical protein
VVSTAKVLLLAVVLALVLVVVAMLVLSWAMPVGPDHPGGF